MVFRYIFLTAEPPRPEAAFSGLFSELHLCVFKSYTYKASLKFCTFKHHLLASYFMALESSCLCQYLPLSLPLPHPHPLNVLILTIRGPMNHSVINNHVAPGSEPSAQSPTRGSNPRTVRSSPEPKSDAQRTEPPRRPSTSLILKFSGQSSKIPLNTDVR